MSARDQIVQAAIALAEVLPPSTMNTLAEAILGCEPSRLRAEITRGIPLPESRGQAIDFVDRWLLTANDLDASSVAMALEAASHSKQLHRDAQSIELVWTGPEAQDVPLRRTEQVILQILDTAKDRITMVSYAVYKIPYISMAISRAARRGVQLTVIVETPDRIAGQSEYSTLAALGDEVAKCSSIYYWPEENRSVGPQGKTGILHAKCLVADGKRLFVSSANLTQQAFSINLELGLLISGSSVPRKVEQVFEGLIRHEVVVPIA